MARGRDNCITEPGFVASGGGMKSGINWRPERSLCCACDPIQAECSRVSRLGPRPRLHSAATPARKSESGDTSTLLRPKFLAAYNALSARRNKEFSILLPETTQSAAMQHAERLRIRISESPLIVLGEAVNLTVSIGVAGSSANTSGIHSLLRRADKALYAAKNLGRNKVEVSPDSDFRAGVAAE